ncbi:MAG: hypothetical protein AW12_02108 [Candidatus Accumulibacter sp. BA-94]|nr:MAG: hypothetical protein AW12_02108 [Candidatus Accumulibacter sp. BA-94]
MAVFLLDSFGLEEALGIEAGPDPRGESSKERRAAGQQAGFDHRCLDGDVAGRLFQALVDGAHAVAGFQPDIPEQADQLLELGGQRTARLPG